jgi:heme/copper-type cytochrome/quinol oxidase subunit 2
MAKKSKTYVWRDPTTLGRIAVGVSAAFALVFLCRGVLQLMFGQAANYAYVVAGFTWPQALSLLADLLYMVLLLGVIPVLMWVYRVSCNAHSRGRSMAHSPISAIVWFLVPFAGWFVPYLVMAEIWEKSALTADQKRSRIVGGWWANYIVFSLTIIVSHYIWAWALVGNLAGIAAAVLFILLVRRLTRMQIEAHEADLLTGETTDVLQRVSN